jgi:YVTN family beta-propeller protein
MTRNSFTALALEVRPRSARESGSIRHCNRLLSASMTLLIGACGAAQLAAQDKSTHPNDVESAIVYVANELSFSVSAINTRTENVVATITIPGAPGCCPEGVAFTPDSKRAYVAVSESATVAVIDTAIHKAVDVIPWAPCPTI